MRWLVGWLGGGLHRESAIVCPMQHHCMGHGMGMAACSHALILIAHIPSLVGTPPGSDGTHACVIAPVLYLHGLGVQYRRDGTPYWHGLMDVVECVGKG